MPCDVCGKPLNIKDAKIVPPNQMRLWAHNGYGETIGLLAAFPVEERRSKFQLLANSNDTDWAVCKKCYANAGSYMESANPGGMSQEDLDVVHDFLRPLYDSMADEPRARRAGLHAAETDNPTLLDALDRYLEEDEFICPARGNALMFAEAANLATSPLLADIPDWETGQQGARIFGLIAVRLAGIKSSGFHEAMTREEADAFACSGCGASLSL